MFPFGDPDPPVHIEPPIDSEARTYVTRNHIDFFRAVVFWDYEKPCPFVLRHSNCDGDVYLEVDSKDPLVATKWKCKNCTSPGNVLFRELDLKTMSTVRLRQLIYVARQHSSQEDVQKLDYNSEKGHGYHFLRPMTREERHKRQLRIISEATQDFVKERG